MNSQPSSAPTRSMTFDGGGAPATTIRTWPRPGISMPRSRRCPAAPVVFDSGKDDLAVHLALHDLRAAHSGHRVGHAPAIAVEHGQRVQEDVAVGGGEPAVAMGELDAFGSGRRAAGVVDTGGGVLVGRPPLRHGTFGGLAK